ncbi:unnamed protein product [Trichobilharzia szidati]|nr:unnamed protein product [Trichobilharzia szidati]
MGLLLYLKELITLTIKVILSIIYDCFETLKLYMFPVYKDISEDVILITGAGNGIGREMCLQFSKHCSNILALDVDEEGLQETAVYVKNRRGVQIKQYLCDLSSLTDIDRIVNEILQDYGRVTILVNNAAIINLLPLLHLSLDKFDKCFRVNLYAYFYLIKGFLPGMLGTSMSSNCSNHTNNKPARGHIVYVSSGGGLLPVPRYTDYCATKAGGLLLSESLELELKEMGVADQIHITRVIPHIVRTKLVGLITGSNSPLLPLLEPEECARQIVDGVLRNKSVVYIPRIVRLMAILKILSPNYAMSVIRNYFRQKLLFSTNGTK